MLWTCPPCILTEPLPPFYVQSRSCKPLPVPGGMASFSFSSSLPCVSRSGWPPYLLLVKDRQCLELLILAKNGGRWVPLSVCGLCIMWIFRVQSSWFTLTSFPLFSQGVLLVSKAMWASLRTAPAKEGSSGFHARLLKRLRGRKSESMWLHQVSEDCTITIMWLIGKLVIINWHLGSIPLKSLWNEIIN